MPHKDPAARTAYRKRYYAAHREQAVKYAAEWKRENKERVNARSRELWGTEKHRARAAVSNAVRDGRLHKSAACSRCGQTCPLQAHHADYAKSLEVIWLCVSCHVWTHHSGAS